ncbi:MAG TPA: chromate efflux transporter [Labilithrix sp.]|nr:chromate efflux transporter [Labilithrix sp.]
MTDALDSAGSSRKRLVELALLFLRLGTTAFGGPAAHIAIMEDEVVRRRSWLTREEFLDLLGAANLIPGPNSTELAIHIGHRRAGWAGLVVAGVCFILPAALITWAFAWTYVRFGALPEARWVLYGVKPVVIAVVVQALWGLARSAVKTPVLGVIGVAALSASAIGVDELLVLAVGGVAAMLARPRAAMPHAVFPAGIWTTTAASAGGLGVAAPASLGGLFFTFAKIGSVLFGSGYVLLAFLRADLVEERHWLNEQQLLDAVAVGQVTPGPVFTTATFVGYVIHGTSGALAATAGIFLPAFFFVALSGPLIPRLRRSPHAGALLDGVNVASLGLMAAVSIELGHAALVDSWTLGLATLSALLLFRFKVNSAWLVLGGAAAGGIIHSLK